MDEKLMRLIKPHLTQIEIDGQLPRMVPCEEGTNVCGKEDSEHPGMIDTLTEDFVLIRDSDEIVHGRLRFLPSHRACAVSEWGEDHILPKRGVVGL